MSKLVSVLIPVYSDGQYLTEALDSVYNQEQVSQDEIEVLVVLDRPTEKLISLVAAYRKSNMKVIHAECEGLVSALNTGLQAATGRYISRLDADDIMKPLRISKQARFLDLNPDVLVVGSQVEVIDQFGDYQYNSEFEVSSATIRKFMKYVCYLSHPSTMFRKYDVMQIGGYREFYRHAEDFDLWSRLLEIGEIGIIDEVLTSYRIHTGQISHRKSIEQQFATRAVVESVHSKSLGGKDLSEEFDSVDDWITENTSYLLRSEVFLSHYYADALRRKSAKSYFLLPLVLIFKFKYYFLKVKLKLGILAHG